MTKRHAPDRSPAETAGADEILYCERCGISFLWSSEEQSALSDVEASGQTGHRIARAPRPQHCPACRRLLPAPSRERGLVKWFSRKKRYGFLVRSNQPDLFVHLSELQPGVRLLPGDLVEFEVAESDRGPSATQVTLLQHAGAAP